MSRYAENTSVPVERSKAEIEMTLATGAIKIPVPKAHNQTKPAAEMAAA